MSSEPSEFPLGVLALPLHYSLVMRYFDHNATSTLLPVAREAWLSATDELFGNASSLHRIGQRADRAVETARETFARVLGCHAPDIVWTSGATESANTLMRHLAATNPGDRPIWISAIEHPSVLESARHYFGERVTLMPVHMFGVVDLAWLDKNLTGGQRPVAIALMAANNETGVLQPWDDIRDLCLEMKILFICDATQWIGRLPAEGLGQCDFVLGSAHKSGGPKGVGFLKCPGGTRLEPLIHGGGQQDGRRAGTENVAGIVSWEAALIWCEQQIANGEHHERQRWRDEFFLSLSSKIETADLIGDGVTRLWNTVSVELSAPDCQQRWAVKLDRAGFAASSGSACASGDEKPSHVLLAMDRDQDQISRTVRLSSGWQTSREDWAALSDAIGLVWKNWSSVSPNDDPISGV